MSEPFVGQIIAVGFNFAPPGWAFCDGQSVDISSYAALFNLIGTTYGGDGQTTFKLPDLRGRGAAGFGQAPGLSDYALGQQFGTENITLLSSQWAAHAHSLTGSATATTSVPAADSLLGTSTTNIYATSGAVTGLAGSAVTPTPNPATPHENRQPFQTINYIIALYGIFPTPPP